MPRLSGSCFVKYSPYCPVWAAPRSHIMAIPVKLPVFEGPLDLLMHLIEKNKIDIYDIPIVEITDQYLDYVHQMDHEDMDVTSEFLVMAATLLDIKSRMLLPREKDEETGEEEGDPREELVRRLLEYKMYKYMSEELAACREQAGVRYFRAQDLPKEVRSYQPPIDYEDLLKGTDLKRLETVFGEVLRRKKSRRDPIRSGFGKIKREEVNIDTKTLYIRAYLQAHPQTDFRALLESQESKEEVIVTFLILLELMKHQKVHIIQDSICGKILIESAETEESSSSPLPPDPSRDNADGEVSEVTEDNFPAEVFETAGAEDLQAEVLEDAAAEDIHAEVLEDAAAEDIHTEVLEAAAAEDIHAEVLDETVFIPEKISDRQTEESSPAEEPVDDYSGIRSLSIHNRIEVVSPVFPDNPESTPSNMLIRSDASSTVNLSTHLWYGKIPAHISPLCNLRGGAARVSRLGRQASCCRLRRANPVWEQARLSRLWARRL